MSNPKMYLVVMMVTPALAAKWLEESGGNRKMEWARVAAYEAAMRRGEWRLTAQGIIFDINGKLTNGHHRLEAVVRSGVTVEFSVTYNQPLDARVLEDGNRPMLAQHAFRREGNASVTSLDVSLARNFDCIELPLKKAPYFSPIDIQGRLRQWASPIRYATKTCRKSPGMCLAVQALVARASGHADLDRLAEFASVFANKGCVLNTETDSAAVKFYGLCLRAHRSKERVELASLYHKGASALLAFLDGEDLRSIRDTTRNAFPVIENYSHVAEWLSGNCGTPSRDTRLSARRELVTA